MQWICSLLALLIVSLPGPACINVDGTNLDGDETSQPMQRWLERLRAALGMTAEQKIEEYQRHRNPDNHDPMADRELAAVKDLMAGRVDAAIAALQQIETAAPGRYSTATNLGTAYELAGKNDEALAWIRKGIERNPNAHAGTEWLHAHILETKIKLAADPGLLQHTRVIPLPDDFGNQVDVPAAGGAINSHELADAIAYQLTERLLFVKPADPVVADLLFTLARLESKVAVVEQAMVTLDLSSQYGFADPALLNATRARFQQALDTRRAAEARQWWIVHSLYAALVLALAALSYFVYRRLRAKSKPAAE